MLCPRCLDTVIQLIYPASCRFDDCGVESDGLVHWLDLKFAKSTCGTTLVFTPKPIEPDWIAGRYKEPVRWHLPPTGDRGGALVTELRSLVAGRLTRLAQIGVDDGEKVEPLNMTSQFGANMGIVIVPLGDHGVEHIIAITI